MAGCWRGSISIADPIDHVTLAAPAMATVATSVPPRRRADQPIPSTASALVNPTPKAVPAAGPILVHGASRSSCSGPGLLTKTSIDTDPDDHAPSSGW